MRQKNGNLVQKWFFRFKTSSRFIYHFQTQTIRKCIFLKRRETEIDSHNVLCCKGRSIHRHFRNSLNSNVRSISTTNQSHMLHLDFEFEIKNFHTYSNFMNFCDLYYYLVMNRSNSFYNSGKRLRLLGLKFIIDTSNLPKVMSLFLHTKEWTFNLVINWMSSNCSFFDKIKRFQLSGHIFRSKFEEKWAHNIVSL